MIPEMSSPPGSPPGFFGPRTPLAAPGVEIRVPELPPAFLEAHRGNGASPELAAKALKEPTPKQRLVHRATMGWTLAEPAAVQQLGYDGYLERQLDYESIDDSPLEDALHEALPSLSMTPFEQLMGGFAGALAAFHGDMTSGNAGSFTLVAMTEFGRNAFENASAGTDHGHGGVMIAMGQGLRGGQVLTDWPGLAPEQLYDGQDLAIAVDYRDVLTEILAKRLGNPDHAAVFPDPSYEPHDYGIAEPAS